MESKKGSEFFFDYVHLLYYKCHKINLNRGGSYIDSPDWIKNKKVTVNPINKKDNTCCQYAVTIALNHGEIKNDLQILTKVKSSISIYNWKGINYPTKKDDWKKSEKNNVTIALNVLYFKKEKIYPKNVSKHNSNCEKQIIILMIPNGEGWHYLAVKKLSPLLRGITSKHHSAFYCMNCLHSCSTEYKRESHKKVCENKDFRNAKMPSEDTKILESLINIKNLTKHHLLLFMQILNV